MWKSIRSLFFPSGGSSEIEDRAADTKLRQLWIALVRLGMARGLKLPDAEDLAQESIVAGMESFDPAKGEFGAFCRTIMANRAKNLHRATKPQVPISEDGGTFADQGDGPGWANYHKQCREKADRILADTVSSLDEEEANFFLVLAEVHGELNHGEVSEAARRAGVTPQKGWDIFRKIQRRFKVLDRTILLPERPPVRADDGSTRWSLSSQMSNTSSGAHSLSDSHPPPNFNSSDGTYLGHFRGCYRRFSTNLGPGSMRKLRRLLGQ